MPGAGLLSGRPGRGAARAVAIAVLALLAVIAAPVAASRAATPEQDAEALRSGLFDAQTELILGDQERATAAAERVARRYRGTLRAGIRANDPAADAAARAALRDARRAAADGDAEALAAARGTLRGALLRGAFAATIAAVRAGDAEAARSWLLLREFRAATRLTRPGADATLAVEGLAAGRTSPDAAAQAVAKDLLDAYQGRQRDLLGDADSAAERGLGVPLAEATAAAAAYWPILAPRYTEDRGQAAADALGAQFAALAAAGAQGDVAGRARGARRDRRGPEELHRRAAHGRGVGPARAAAPALPRARPGRVRPRRLRHAGHARLRDPGGRRLPHGRRGRDGRPPGPARQARPRAGRRRRARPRRAGGDGRPGDRSARTACRRPMRSRPSRTRSRTRSTPRCPRRGRRPPTSPTTT